MGKSLNTQERKMEQTQLDIGTIGQRLSAGRLQKGVSVSEAAAATRILSKYIAAMEADDFSVLSAPVYVKSFIRLYAKYLEIEVAPLVEDYQREYEEASTPQLTDDVRMNLAKADVPASDSVAKEADASRQAPWGGFREITTLSSQIRFSDKQKIMGLVGILVLILLIVGVRQCEQDEGPIEIPEGVSSVDLPMISQPLPDLYLNESGSLDWER
jgi:transcriptional regulator with XRE-family HTH domain